MSSTVSSIVLRVIIESCMVLITRTQLRTQFNASEHTCITELSFEISPTRSCVPSPIASKSRSILSTFSAESWEIKAEILAVGPYVDLRLSEIFRASCQSVAYAPLHKDSAGRDADLARVDEGSGYDTFRSGVHITVGENL